MSADLIDRTDEIRERVDHMCLVQIRVPVAPMPLDEWLVLDKDVSERWGFMWPRPFEDGLVVVYCPEMVAAQTCWLDDNQFQVYMDCIEFVISKHIALDDTIDTFEERRQVIEDDLWDANPEAMQFLSHVQATILDMEKGEV